MTARRPLRLSFNFAAAATVAVVCGTACPVQGADLSGPWKFRYEDGIETTASFQMPGFDDSPWESVKVPHVWPDDKDGAAWYRLSVPLEASAAKAAAEGQLHLLFRQVDDSAYVYLNGQLVREHHAWNRAFTVPLGPALAGMKQGDPLLIAVRVVDRGHEGGILKGVEMTEAVSQKELYRTEWSDKTAISNLSQNGEMVMYSVYIRNFTPEGTVDALRERLPELRGLGVNILWLLPIHEIGVEARKGGDGSPYAIKDYFSIDPNTGDKEDFRNLVKEAHRLGMKVIIDCVMNHMSPDSEMAKEHPEMFIKGKDGKPVADNPDWHDIVDWDWENKAVWEYGWKAMEYWVREFDIDGYRCDVADLMPGDFWIEARKRLDAIKPGKIVMLAESRSPAHHLQGFDLTYGEDLWDAAGSVCAGRQPVAAIREAMDIGQYGYPKGSTQILFTENHDKERAVNQFGGPEQAKLVGVISATLPGVPMLYTGTEVGAAADRDDTFFDRSPVDFTSDLHGMRAFWATLLALRAEHPALQTGELKFHDATPAVTALVYERTGSGDRVLVVCNFSNANSVVTVKDPLVPEGSVQLAPWGWAVFSEPVPSQGTPGR